MGHPDEDGLGGNLALLGDRPASGDDRLAPQAQGIDADHGNAPLAVVEHGRPDLAG